MPLYDYKCNECDSVFEIYEHYDEKTDKCPRCNSNNVIRLIGNSKAFVPRDPREELIKIKREAKEIAKKIINGDQETYHDIYGDKHGR